MMSEFTIGSKVKVLNGPHKNEMGFIESVELKEWDDAEPETVYEVRFNNYSYPFTMFKDQLQKIETGLFEQVVFGRVH